jgi:hypothetical protein
LPPADHAAAESEGGVACRRAGKYENPTMTPISIVSSHTFIGQHPSSRFLETQEAAEAFKELLLERRAATPYLGVMS